MSSTSNKCNLCPRKCNVDRNNNELGYCKSSKDITIARYSLHAWEEPCLSGTNGSGTIFFSNCNMGCIFCQNYELSHNHKGRKVSIDELSNICLSLQANNAHNINLVTPTHYVPWIIESLKQAKSKGLTIPIIYNTGSYETKNTIQMLKGLIDIYLPDLKFYDNSYAEKYANTPNYFQYATIAIDEMINQVGPPKFDKNGLLKKGIIVRHMVMPGLVEDSKKIIKYLYDTYKDKIIISIMNQYTPVRHSQYEQLNRCLTEEEYNEVIDYAYNLGVRNAYTQENGTKDESFIPNFDEFKGI